jgi:hypothetical protein
LRRFCTRKLKAKYAEAGIRIESCVAGYITMAYHDRYIKVIAELEASGHNAKICHTVKRDLGSFRPELDIFLPTFGTGLQ